eukprot:COSAG02_NODE_143_length_34133_cov_272.981282_24_plen_123_part_00
MDGGCTRSGCGTMQGLHAVVHSFVTMAAMKDVPSAQCKGAKNKHSTVDKMSLRGRDYLGTFLLHYAAFACPSSCSAVCTTAILVVIAALVATKVAHAKRILAVCESAGSQAVVGSKSRPVDV